MCIWWSRMFLDSRCTYSCIYCWLHHDSMWLCTPSTIFWGGYFTCYCYGELHFISGIINFWPRGHSSSIAGKHFMWPIFCSPSPPRFLILPKTKSIVILKSPYTHFLNTLVDLSAIIACLSFVSIALLLHCIRLSFCEDGHVQLYTLTMNRLLN